MGFGTVATHAVLFITMVTLAAAFSSLMVGQAQMMSSSFREQRELTSQQIRTDISIVSTTATNISITMYVRNTGKTMLQPNQTDLFVDGLRIQNVQRTIETDTDTIDLGIWNPGELLRIDSTTNLDSGSHRATVSTEYGINAESTVTV